MWHFSKFWHSPNPVSRLHIKYRIILNYVCKILAKIYGFINSTYIYRSLVSLRTNAIGHKSTSTLPKFCTNEIEWIIAVWNISSYKMSEKTKQNLELTFFLLALIVVSFLGLNSKCVHNINIQCWTKKLIRQWWLAINTQL